jgi:hypothetical protein
MSLKIPEQYEGVYFYPVRKDEIASSDNRVSNNQKLRLDKESLIVKTDGLKKLKNEQYGIFATLAPHPK